ncbi:hypothetical protein CCP1ISM_160006 [Azospirillaceae bacterium]
MDKDQEATMNAISVIETEKVSSLMLLNEDQKQAVISSIKYMAIPYMPITKEFIGNTILNEVEYPLLESKMSQAAIEMKSRFNRLIDGQYDLEKTELELQELDIEIDEIRSDDSKSPARRDIEVKKKELEKKIKGYRYNSLKQSMVDSFKEFVNWKETLDTLLDEMRKTDPEIKTVNDVDFNKIRVEEMKIKVQRWMEMHQKGDELTASQKIFVYNEIIREQLGIGHKKDE